MNASAARSIDLLLVRLELGTALSVAAPEVAVIKGVDLPVAKDPLTARPYVPTTGVVGSLRSHALDRGTDAAAVVGLFGGRPEPGPAAGDDAGRADDRLVPSVLRAMGTRLVDHPTASLREPQLRTQTAIDRRRASAVDGSLRTRESLPSGAVVELYLSLVGAGEDQVDLLRDLLATWRPVLGGGRSVGYGRAAVESVRHRRLDLSTPHGLTTWLALGGPGTWDAEHGWTTWKVAPAGADKRDLQLSFKTSGDVMVGSGKRASGDDGAKAAQIMRAGEKPIIPGSALRGVFRSRLEFVLRSMDLRACLGTPGAGDDACVENPCLVCVLFGRAGNGGRRGALAFHDATFTKVTEAKRMHVAIDRFTGGASSGLLFSQEVVESARVTITVRVDPRVDLDLARAVLEVVAVDLHDGYVGIGHGTARGMGDLRLTDEAGVRRNWQPNLSRIRAAASGEDA